MVLRWHLKVGRVTLIFLKSPGRELQDWHRQMPIPVHGQIYTGEVQFIIIATNQKGQQLKLSPNSCKCTQLSSRQTVPHFHLFWKKTCCDRIFTALPVISTMG